jgi:hypothetical protein
MHTHTVRPHDASGLDLRALVAEVEAVGFAVVRGALPLDLCARAATHVDAVLGDAKPLDPSGRGPTGRSHPIPGPIMGELLSVPAVLAVAAALGRAPLDELRLTEQVLLRTHPVPPEMMHEPGPTPRGWHLDDIATPEMFNATPRQTYFQMFAALRDILPGAGGTMVVPCSHHRTMEAAAERRRSGSAAGGEVDLDSLLAEIQAAPLKFGIDPSLGVEIPAQAGSLLIFDPGCLHSSSENRGEASRYVLVQSFYHATDATVIHDKYSRLRYLKAFHADTHAAVAPALRPLLHGKALWGEAMRDEMAQWQTHGWFACKEPIVAAEQLRTLVTQSGEGGGAHRFLAALKAAVSADAEPPLMSVLEAAPTLALAAELLGVNDGDGSHSSVAALAVTACDIGSRFGDHQTNSERKPCPEAGLLAGGEEEGRLLPGEVTFVAVLDVIGAAHTLVCSSSAGKPAIKVAAAAASLLAAGSSEGGCWGCFVSWSYGKCDGEECDGGGGEVVVASAVREVFAQSWEGWGEPRQRLWGVHHVQQQNGGAVAKL